MAESVIVEMALVSRLWPFLNPLTLKDFDVSWWAYYVRGARAYRESLKPQTTSGGRRGR